MTTYYIPPAEKVIKRVLISAVPWVLLSITKVNSHERFILYHTNSFRFLVTALYLCKGFTFVPLFSRPIHLMNVLVNTLFCLLFNSSWVLFFCTNNFWVLSTCLQRLPGYRLLFGWNLWRLSLSLLLLSFRRSTYNPVESFFILELLLWMSCLSLYKSLIICSYCPFCGILNPK